MSFGELLVDLRRDRDVSRKALSAGLMSESALARIEADERFPDRVLRDRLLDRLGCTQFGGEDYLDGDEYTTLHRMEQVSSYYQRKDYKKATSLIDTLEEKNRDNRCVMQYLLLVRAWIARRRRAPGDRVHLLFRKALLCTLPEEALTKMPKVLLSVQEYALLVDYLDTLPSKRAADEGPDRTKYYEQILLDMEHRKISRFLASSIYPKIAVSMYRHLKKTKTATASAIQIRQLCEKAIEMLRFNNSFYLTELLEAYLDLCERYGTDDDGALYEKARGWLSSYKEVAKAFRCDPYTTDELYLYRLDGCHEISRVVRIRRQMYGMTQEQLAEKALCDPKTIRRIEQGKTVPQKAVFESVYRALGLHPEYNKAEIVTDRAQALELLNMIRAAANRRQLEDTSFYLQQLQRMIPMDNPVNRQYIGVRTLQLQLQNHTISRESYVEKIRQLLALTLPEELLFCGRELYLTWSEKSCLFYLIKGLDGEERHRYADLLQALLDIPQIRKGAPLHISDHLFLGFVASELGNRQEYELSDEISSLLVHSAYAKRVISPLHDEVYNVFWNRQDRLRRDSAALPAPEDAHLLELCMSLATFTKNDYLVSVYSERLKRYFNNEGMSAE